MLCPVCEGDFLKVNEKRYDSEIITVCKCMDCKHEFKKENALPHTMKLPENDNLIGDEDV